MDFSLKACDNFTPQKWRIDYCLHCFLHNEKHNQMEDTNDTGKLTDRSTLQSRKTTEIPITKVSSAILHQLSFDIINP